MSDGREHGLRGRLVVATKMCPGHEEEIKGVHADMARLRAALEMTLDRVIELEVEREKLLRALEAFEGQRK